MIQFKDDIINLIETIQNSEIFKYSESKKIFSIEEIRNNLFNDNCDYRIFKNIIFDKSNNN